MRLCVVYPDVTEGHYPSYWQLERETVIVCTGSVVVASAVAAAEAFAQDNTMEASTVYSQ